MFLVSQRQATWGCTGSGEGALLCGKVWKGTAPTTSVRASRVALSLPWRAGEYSRSLLRCCAAWQPLDPRAPLQRWSQLGTSLLAPATTSRLQHLG